MSGTSLSPREACLAHPYQYMGELMRRWIAVLFLVMLWLPAYAVGENWPQFRGPGSRGVAIDSGLPDTWDTTQNVRWKIDIPGSGETGYSLLA
jgi:hypothetical protein